MSPQKQNLAPKENLTAPEINQNRQDLTGLSLDLRESQSNQKKLEKRLVQQNTAAEMDSVRKLDLQIDLPEFSPEKKETLFSQLEEKLSLTLTSLIHSGALTFEQIKNGQFFDQLKTAINLPSNIKQNIAAPEESHLDILKKILTTKTSTIKDEFLTKYWPKIVENVEKMTVTTQAATDILAGRKSPSVKPSTKEKDKGYLEKTIEFAEKNPKTAALLAVGGAYLGYRLLSKLFNFGKEKEKEAASDPNKKGLLSRIWQGLKDLFLIGAGFFVAGKLIGPEKIWEQVSNISNQLKIGKESFLKALALVQKGDYLSAAKELGTTAYTEMAKVLHWPLDIMEKGKEVAIDLYKQLDEKLNLTKFKDQLLKFTTEKFPGAVGTVKEYLEKLSPANIEKWAEGQGFDAAKESLLTWLEKQEVPLEATGFAGIYALLRMFVGKRVANTFALPAVIYFFASTQTDKGDYLRDFSENIGQALDKIKDQVANKLDEFHIPWIKEALNEVQIKGTMGDIMDYLEKNPLEAAAYLSSAWWLKAYIWKLIKFLTNIGWEAAKFSWNHPLVAGSIASVGIAKRRDIINGLADLVPDSLPILKIDDEVMKQLAENNLDKNKIKKLVALKEKHLSPKELDKKLKELHFSDEEITQVLHSSDGFRQTLLRMVYGEKDRGDLEEILNSAVDATIITGAEGLLETIKSTKDVIQAVRNGELIALIPDGLNITWHIAKDFTPIGIAAKFTTSQLKEIYDELANEKDTSLTGVLIPGVGAAIGAISVWEGYKAICHIKSLPRTTFTRGFKIAKTLIPFTKEGRFLIRSMRDASIVIPVQKISFLFFEKSGLKNDVLEMENLLKDKNYADLKTKASDVLKFLRSKGHMGGLEGNTFSQKVKSLLKNLEEICQGIYTESKYGDSAYDSINEKLQEAKNELSFFNKKNRSDQSESTKKSETTEEPKSQSTSKEGETSSAEESAPKRRPAGFRLEEPSEASPEKPKTTTPEGQTTAPEEPAPKLAEVKVGPETVKLPEGSATNKLRLSLLEKKLPEKAGQLLMIYATITGIHEVGEIMKAKKELEKIEKELLAADPSHREQIMAAMEEQINLLSVQEWMCRGNIGAGGTLIFQQSLQKLKDFFPKLTAISSKLEFLGPLANRTFAVLAVADLITYNAVQVPRLQANIEELTKTIEANRDHLPKEAVAESLKLVAEQTSLLNEQRIVSNLHKLFSVGGLILGGATMTAVLASTPYMYMYSYAMEARQDVVKTPTEWAKSDKDILLNDWLTTVLGSAKDQYRLWNRASNKEYEEEAEKAKVRENIIIALLMKEETDPTRIKNRQAYIKAVTGNYYVNSFERAKSILEQSKTFADALPEIDNIIETYKKEKTASLRNQEILLNLKKIKSQGLGSLDIKTAAAIISTYKKSHPEEAFKKPDEPESLNKLPAGLQKGLYSLALYLGYEGSANFSDLHKFFTEAHKDQRGLYFGEDGTWHVNNIRSLFSLNTGRDFNAGNDNQTLSKIIEYMKTNSDTILQDRLNSSTDSRERDADILLKRKVESMIEALEKGQEQQPKQQPYKKAA